MAELKEVAEILSFLASLYPRFELPTRTIRAYATILGDIPADLLKKAAIHVGSRNTFFPSAAELRNAVFELSEKAKGLPTADEAWAEVCEKFSLGFSRYRPPKDEDWSHLLVKKALDGIGGWRYMCDSENLTADRARFIQAYQIHVKRDQENVRMLPDVRETVHQLATGSNGDEPETISAIKALTANMKVKM